MFCKVLFVLTFFHLAKSAPRKPFDLQDAISVLDGPDDEFEKFRIPTSDGDDIFDRLSAIQSEGQIPRVAVETNVALNCRIKIDTDAEDAETCASQTQSDGTPAKCRWEKRITGGACLCPRSLSQCLTKGQCYWQKNSDDILDGECIHSSQRFYNLLHHHLSKRGKKSFAIKLAFNSNLASGRLPFGPFGPKVIDIQSPYYQYQNYEKFQLPPMGGFFPFAGAHSQGISKAHGNQYPTFYPSAAGFQGTGNAFGQPGFAPVNQGYNNHNNNVNQGYANSSPAENGQTQNNNNANESNTFTNQPAQRNSNQNQYPTAYMGGPGSQQFYNSRPFNLPPQNFASQQFAG